ncbi:MAG: nitroreductase family deazaflavin-dependent oxidoreductase [Dehalococcoidia bacterium]|nr:nitroreductase family deazaflavin-dependent oxidoreductase [Dehalococcoidia bacterium]
MDPAVRTALEANPVADITINKRKSGGPHRMEIWVHAFEGRVFLAGRPVPKSWYANLLADPSLTLHVKNGATADIPMRARAITDPVERRAVFPLIVERNNGDIEEWVAGAKLMELTEA